MNAPEYKAIVTGAATLNIIGTFLFILAGGLAGGAILIAGISSGRMGEQDRMMLLASSILITVAMAAAGAVIRMLSALALAIRDMARNSWGR